MSADRLPEPPAVFTPLLEACGTALVLARGIAEHRGTVRSWYLRDSVPAGYWDVIAAFAASQGIAGVTFEDLRAAGAVVAQRQRTHRTTGRQPIRACGAVAA